MMMMMMMMMMMITATNQRLSLAACQFSSSSSDHLARILEVVFQQRVSGTSIVHDKLRIVIAGYTKILFDETTRGYLIAFLS